MSSAPLNDLELIVAAANSGNVGMLRKVQTDYQELGYSLDEVHDCLACLRASDFAHSKDYGAVAYDVYTPRYRVSSGQIDQLYVKLMTPATTVPQVLLASFHIQR